MKLTNEKKHKDEWVGIIYKEDVMNVIIILLLGAFMIGLVDGLTEQLSVEAFVWPGILTFTIVLIFYFIFHNKKIVLGLTLSLYGAFIGLMQTTFGFIYIMMRGEPQGPLMGELWIIPGVVFSLNQFYLSIVFGFIMMIVGYMLLRSS